MLAGKRKAVSGKMAAAFVAVLIAIAAAAVLVNQSIKANSIYVNSSVIILGVGQEYNLPVESNALLKYKSYNENVVKVDRNGKFTAVSKGEALVKVGLHDVAVVVDNAPDSVCFSQAQTDIGNGEKYRVNIQAGSSGCNSGFEFTSSDENILTVDSLGEITGVSNGTAKLSVKTYNGLTASCSITVKDAPEEITYPYSAKTVYLGTTANLCPSVSSGSASKTTQIISDNQDIVKVEGTKLIPVSEGKATVTASTYNGKTAQCEISVVEAPFYIRTDLDPSLPMIALSFDDGPNYPSTNAILDVLEQYNCSATFFIVSSRLDFGGNDKCAKRMVDIGCQLGNHTYDHKHYGADVTVDDITKGAEKIKEVTGYAPSAYRPTGGYMSDLIKENCGAPICLWSVDTNDWSYRNAEKLYNYVLYAVDDGDIILMHDIYSTSATAVEWFVPELVNRGYQIVNIAELAYYKDAQLESGSVYSSFK